MRTVPTRALRIVRSSWSSLTCLSKMGGSASMPTHAAGTFAAALVVATAKRTAAATRTLRSTTATLDGVPSLPS